MDQALKDPDATVDYERDWSLWMAAGDTIVTSTWIVPTGLTKTDESNTTTTATVWLSGGAVGETYRVTNRIVTAQNRIDDRSLQIVVCER